MPADTTAMLTTATLAAGRLGVRASEAIPPGDLMLQRGISFLGMFVLLLIAWLFCRHKRQINKRAVFWGLGLQLIMAVLVLGVPAVGIRGPFSGFFLWFNDAFNRLMEFSDKGAGFVFGRLASMINADTGQFHPWGMVFAFRVLPTIIFFSSLMTVLYYLGVMQKLVYWSAWLMQKFMGTSGAETLSTAANIFVGQTEAPLAVRPYVSRMTRSELFVVMAGGMANTAGGVMAAYVAMLSDRMPNIAGHLMTATLMSAPASFAICKIMEPETEVPETLGTVNIHQEKFDDANVIEAAARGAGDGLTLALNVAAMLIAFIAFVALGNSVLTWLGELIGFSTWGGALVPASLMDGGQAHLTLEVIFSWVFAPLAFVMGVPWHECGLVGALLGQKVAINEFVAYSTLQQVGGQLSDRGMIIASYALSGFANFASIAIQIGGIGGMAPTRRGDLARLGLKAIIGGSLATFLTATIAGFLI